MDNKSNVNGQINVAIYSRVSTQEQASEGTSMDMQKDQLENYCPMQSWTIINSYTDPGFSGKDEERPGLQRLLSDANAGLFDKVLIYKLDRLARNLRLLLDIEARLRERNISLTSMKESIDTQTAMGKMVFQLFGMIAEWERETIIERTKSGRLQRYKDGCWAGGKPLFGYAYDKETKKLVINNDEALVVRRIYSDYTSGKSLNAIATSLNEEKVHVRGKSGKGWRQTSIRLILINPAYHGNEVVNRFSNINDINKIDLSKTIQFSIPAIVSDEIWHQVQERLSINKHIKPKMQGAFLLQGLITCCQCGLAYRSAWINGIRYYVCRGKLKASHVDGSPKCKSLNLKAEWLENEVWTKIMELLNNPNRLADIINASIEDLRLREKEISTRIKPIEEQLNEITLQKSKLADDWIIHNMNRAKYQEIQQNLDKEESRLKVIRSNIDPAQINELEKSQGMLRFWEGLLKSMVWNTENEDGSMARVVEKPHDTALKVIGFDDKDLTKRLGFPATKRELLDRFQLKVVVFNDRIEIKSLFPIEPIDCQKFTSTKCGMNY